MKEKKNFQKKDVFLPIYKVSFCPRILVNYRLIPSKRKFIMERKAFYYS